MHKNFNIIIVVKGKQGVGFNEKATLFSIRVLCNGGSMHVSLSLYVSISWIISQLNALGKNWFPFLQTTSLMRVSFRAPPDTITHHQTQRKCEECSNNTCHDKIEGV